MTALQASIGSLNDLVDAPADAGRKPGKPIPAGLVSARDGARSWSSPRPSSGSSSARRPGACDVALAAVVLAIGLRLRPRFKGTAWSWVPFAVGIPLLPVFGWLGAAGQPAGLFVVLVPVAVAGRRRRSPSPTPGPTSSATRRPGSIRSRSGSGCERAWSVQARADGAVVGVGDRHAGAAGAPVGRAGHRGRRRLASSRSASPSAVGATARRTSGPGSSQAIGVGLLAAAWLAGLEPVSAAGRAGR